MFVFFSSCRNEVLHGGELLKIRGLCRNKQAQPTSSMNETSSLHYSSAVAAAETVCDKTLYDQHNERMGNNNNAIIKESPVIVTSPQHMGNATTTHKPTSSSSSSTSSATTSGPGLCPPDQDNPKRVRQK